MSAMTLVYDMAGPHFQGNRILDRQQAGKYPGALTWAVLGERAAERGWSVMTADVYLRGPSTPAVCISEMVTPYTHTLLERGVVPAAILCGESPNVAWRFYHWLAEYARPYHHAYVFRGAIARVPLTVQAHALFWPNALRGMMPTRAWPDRQHLVMIASNKDRFMAPANSSLPAVWRFAKRVFWPALAVVDPLFRFQDLYQRRLEAIAHFSETPGFRLYGTGWDSPRVPPKYIQAARRVGVTPVADKLGTMSGFKFALCFENCVFPGYLTEKVFDCFLAGCIPVYWGAPDVSDLIPVESYIDVRRFEDWADLDRYLHEMSATVARAYTESARKFLTSEASQKFDQDHTVSELLRLLEPEIVNDG